MKKEKESKLVLIPQVRVLLALKELAIAADDVVTEFEKETTTCGPDLADSIRVLLKPALLYARWALKK